MQRTISILLRILNIILHTQHLNIVLRGQIIRHRIHVIAIIADHANACHVKQIVLDRLHRQRQILAPQLAENGIDGLQPAFHVMDGIMGETHLELGIENLQFGADLIHRALIHLHLINELGNLIGRQRTIVESHRLQPCLQFTGIDAALSIKYHGSIVYPKGARKN